MSDAWQEIQAIKNKRNSLREKLEKRKKARQDILVSSLGTGGSPVNSLDNSSTTSVISTCTSKEDSKESVSTNLEENLVKIDPELEKELLKSLNEVTLQLPISSTDLVASLKVTLDRHASHRIVCNLLQKFAAQKLVTVKDNVKDGKPVVEVINVEHTKLNAMVTETTTDEDVTSQIDENTQKRKRDDSPDKKVTEEEDRKKKEKKDPRAADIFVSNTSNIIYRSSDK